MTEMNMAVKEILTGKIARTHNRVEWGGINRPSPLTPPYVRFSYTAVR